MQKHFIKFQCRQRGFTIIELIVVVVIIAVLAAIIMFNIVNYIDKGKGSAIKGNLITLTTKGMAYFDNNGNYDSFCTTSSGGASIKKAIEAPNVGGTFVCNCDHGADDSCTAPSTKWCACSPEIGNSGTSYCVDSTGFKKAVTGDCSTICAIGACSGSLPN